MPPDSTEGAAADAALERAIPHSTEPLGATYGTEGLRFES